jgi:hypothetical protein
MSMSNGSFVHGALIDLDPDDLSRMLDLDESLFVEHKTGIGKEEAHGLVKAIASFANTLGGWVLVGIRSGKPLDQTPDWAASDAPPLVDFVRSRLRGALDPMPAFEAKVLPHGDGRIGVVRVYESTDTPHVAIGPGAVYVREVAEVRDAAAPGKAEPGAQGERVYRATQIRSSAQLRELASRGKEAEKRVDSLIDPATPLPLVAEALPLRLEPTPAGYQPQGFERPSITVRLAPLTLLPRFGSWSTTADCSSALLTAAERIAKKGGLSNSWVSPDPSGAAIEVPLNPGDLHSDAGGIGLDATAHLVVDGAGVVGAALSLSAPENRDRRRWIRLGDIAGDLIRPVVAAAVGILEAGEFLGRVRCQIDLLGLSSVFLIDQGGNRDGRPWVPSSGDLMLPVDAKEVRSAAMRAANAFGRSAGIAAWDQRDE